MKQKISFSLAFFLLIFFFGTVMVFLPGKASAASQVVCSGPSVYVDNSTGEVTISGDVRELHPEQDPGQTSAHVYDSANVGSDITSGDTSGFASYTKHFNNGTYTAYLAGTGTVPLGNTSSSCSAEKPFTVNVGSAVSGACSSTLNTCTSGTFADVTDSSTQHLWSCNGSGGGTTASCTENKASSPGAFTLSSNTCNNETYDLSWTPSSGVWKYWVYSRAWSNGSWGLSGDTTGTSFHWGPGNKGTHMYFQVSADNGAGGFTWSNEVQATACNYSPVCSALHYSCNTGTSPDASKVDGSTAWTWSCNGINTGSSVSCSENKIVGPSPDLTAGSPSFSTAIVNTPVTFSSLVSNTGSAATGASFNNFFQVATDINDPAKITDLSSTQMSALASGGTNTASQTHTFTSVGTYYVRACADKSDRNSGGSIAESNENNNCSGWGTVTPTNIVNCPTGTHWNGTSCVSCGTDTFWNGTSCVPPGSMPSGTLTGSPSICAISSGSSSCTTTLTLNIINRIPGAQTNVTRPTNVEVISNNQIDNIFPFSKSNVTVDYPSTTFYLNHNTLTFATKIINAVCVSGTGWNSAQKKCVPIVLDPINVSIFANPASMTLPTNYTTLNWVTEGNPDSCTATGDWSGTKNKISGSENKTSLSVGTHSYTINCFKTGKPNATSTITVVVNPVGTVFNGSCGDNPSHFICSSGTSLHQKSSPSKWTWDCVGSGANHTNDSCTERNIPGYKEN